MEHEEHERKVFQELRDLLFEPDGRSRAHAVGYLGNRVEVGEVRLGASRSEGAREVILVYRDLLRRPRRSLGWRMAVADASGARHRGQRVVGQLHGAHRSVSSGGPARGPLCQGHHLDRMAGSIASFR